MTCKDTVTIQVVREFAAESNFSFDESKARIALDRPISKADRAPIHL